MSEFKLQKLVVKKFIVPTYPNLVFISDLSGVRLPTGLAVKVSSIQKDEFKIPDLFIALPKAGYAGLFIELKETYKKFLLADMVTFSKDEHIQAQLKSLIMLRELGYAAEFEATYEGITRLIKWYIDNDRYRNRYPYSRIRSNSIR